MAHVSALKRILSLLLYKRLIIGAAALSAIVISNLDSYVGLSQIEPPNLIVASGLGVIDLPKDVPPVKTESHKKPENTPAFSQPTVNEAPQVEEKQALTKEEILDDRSNRVSETFKIPNSLKQRTGFWFDIYTKYHSKQHVFHHVDYPWIIFGVFDTTEILNGPEHKWTKYHRSQAAVRHQKKKIERTLLNLSRKKNFKKLTPEEARLAALLEKVPGRRQRVFRHAAQNVRMQLGQKDFIERGLTTSSKYLNEMEAIFEEYDLPVEMTRLPLVESSFNENAVSKVGASGIWQFMPGIGKKFMVVNDILDERNSPLKATRAAARLLSQNFKILKSWPLAMTAYNHGPGGLIKASKKLRTNDLAVMIEKFESKQFGFASSNFFCSFLAALHAERYQEEIFGPLEKQAPLQVQLITLKEPVRVRTIAEVIHLPIEKFYELNPELRKQDYGSKLMLKRGYRIFVPPEKVANLEAHFKDLTGRKIARKKTVKVSQRSKAKNISL